MIAVIVKTLILKTVTTVLLAVRKKIERVTAFKRVNKLTIL